MVDPSLLKEIGLTKAEIDIYLVLLKSEQMIASEITKYVQMQRPNVYDALEKLIEKGLAGYVVKNNLKYFEATSPEKLRDYMDALKKDLQEKEFKINNFIDSIKELIPLVKSKVSVETYEGKEGMRTVLFESIRESKKTKKEILGIGIDNLRIKSQDPIYHERYSREREKSKVKSRYIVIEGTKIYAHKNTLIKSLPKQFESPAATYIYGDVVSIWLWFDIPTVIVMRSKEVANSYRSYFEGLWKIAK